MQDNMEAFQEAAKLDLGRPYVETKLIEIGPVVAEAKIAFERVDKWAAHDRLPFDLAWFPLKPTVRKEPKGVVLMVVPFNLPIWIAIGPLASAIAAGCAVAIKPSELTPHFGALLAELLPKYLDPTLYTVVNGTVPQVGALLDLQWDHILYTGGGRVARIILSAAAKTLSPVSTELGGKSPCIVNSDCDLRLAARRILWGKLCNAGQVCTAPDYVLVQRDFAPKLVDAFKATLQEFYPGGAAKSDSYSRMINHSHFKRVQGLIESTRGHIVYGGGTNEDTLFIEPTLVLNVHHDDPLMQEEIFGPALPIVLVDNMDEALEFINSRDHPLALYAFTRSSEFKEKVANNTQSGAISFNETIFHAAVDGLPFGGIGASGSGWHTGKFGFDTFTHLRAQIDAPGWMEFILKGRNPPYSEEKAKAIMNIMWPKLPPRPLPLTHVQAIERYKKPKGWSNMFLLALALFTGLGLLQARRSGLLGQVLDLVKARGA
ncbi:hypothetical protein EWM64_g3678 [Hericium alpestre]|uniref:Aldehyde dehydrogenase n=1 Tax=Hericium alpestre TaxID=135208 RepID=A0A4Z0A3Q8_9AGAM|nr:hypothetical protein EWM64_g3678 [Hericium alpestre]